MPEQEGGAPALAGCRRASERASQRASVVASDVESLESLARVVAGRRADQNHNGCHNCPVCKLALAIIARSETSNMASGM